MARATCVRLALLLALGCTSTATSPERRLEGARPVATPRSSATGAGAAGGGGAQSSSTGTPAGAASAVAVAPTPSAGASERACPSSTTAKALSAPSSADALPPLPLRFVVVEEDAGPVVGDDWLATALGEANRLIGPHGVTFEQVGRAPLAARWAALGTRADRDALAAELEREVVNVFVVRSMRDVDAPSRFIWGVRWRLLRDTSRDYVILASVASPTTLAHELGHLLGLDHNRIDNNAMSYLRTRPSEVAFDRAQGEKMLRSARARVQSRNLVPRPHPTGAPAKPGVDCPAQGGAVPPTPAGADRFRRGD